jgi:hypothetical protein
MKGRACELAPLRRGQGVEILSASMGAIVVGGGAVLTVRLVLRMFVADLERYQDSLERVNGLEQDSPFFGVIRRLVESLISLVVGLCRLRLLFVRRTRRCSHCELDQELNPCPGEGRWSSSPSCLYHPPDKATRPGNPNSHKSCGIIGVDLWVTCFRQSTKFFLSLSAVICSAV